MKTWQCSHGHLLLQPTHGRMLQAELHGHNAFWVNPEPGDTWNTGGDRVWLAPEIAWNWKTRGPIDFSDYDFSDYDVPAAMDPGAWAVTAESEGFCEMSMTTHLRHRHENAEVWVRLTRSFYHRPVADLPGADPVIPTLAYQTDTTLEILNGTPGQRVGTWQLIQVLAGGWLTVATHGPAIYRDYFHPAPESHVETGAAALRFHLTGDCQYKIGVHPTQAIGCLTYDRPVAGGLLRIERRFTVQPWRGYADRPFETPDPQGDAVQVYNDGGQFGGFGEMEYHAPALVVGRGPQKMSDSNLTTITLQTDSSAPR